VQPVSFFGDGTRVPMIVVSPFAKPDFVSHTYTDHVSVLKFIERNWGLSPLSNRSLDRLPNPVGRRGNPYVPANRPAVGDLFDYFDFRHAAAHAAKPAASQARTGTRLAPRVQVGR
jgi:phospholipase C